MSKYVEALSRNASMILFNVAAVWKINGPVSRRLNKDLKGFSQNDMIMTTLMSNIPLNKDGSDAIDLLLDNDTFIENISDHFPDIIKCLKDYQSAILDLYKIANPGKFEINYNFIR